MTRLQVGDELRPLHPFVESSERADSPERLRERATQDGYLFVRGLLGQQPILRLRQDITGILRDVGWLDDGTDPIQAISSVEAKLMGTPEFIPVYDTIQRLESLHTMAHDTDLLRMAASLLGEPGMPQPSVIPRVFFASALEYTTPPHQDFILVQGTPETWTCWIPLGNCPHDLGGLAVLRGSHTGGILPVHNAKGAGGLRIDTEALAGEWHSSPFEMGDVLFFHSKTAHQGLPNRSGNRVRLSVDYRYQKQTDLIMEKNLGVHQGRLSWEQVYQGWTSERYQYYWQDHQRQSVPKVAAMEFDPELSGGSAGSDTRGL